MSNHHARWILTSNLSYYWGKEELSHMAIHVLIADDEFFIRQRIKKIIPWNDLGLDFAGEAENGLEVIHAIDSKPIDIIILDIKMPKMDGISVAEYIHNNYPATRMIILSGYNDFEYARSAIHYGVSDYLSKPVEESLLTSTLIECIHSLNEGKKREQQIKRYYHYELCAMLHHVLYGSAKQDELYIHYPFLKEMDQTLFLAVYITGNPDENILNFTHTFREFGYTCEYSQKSEYIYILQFFLREHETAEPIHTVLTSLLEESEGTLFFCFGDLIPIHADWLPAYKAVKIGLDTRYFATEFTLIPAYAPDCKQSFASELSKIRHKITLCLNNKNEKELTADIDELFEKIETKRDADYLHMILFELFMTFYISHQISGYSSTSITDLTASLLDEEYRLSELRNSTVSYGLQCIQHNASQPSDVALSRKLMNYVKNHYTEPDLSIARIAEEFSLNSSYLGTAFKKANNISILQYITNVRMEAALQLLKEDCYKISEIAEMIGYSDVFYFSKRFKTAYGYPPKDYALHLTD